MPKLNQWLGLIANLGVVIGLLLLVYELKQSRDVAIFQTVQANREQKVEYFTAMRDSDYHAALRVKIREGTKFTPEEDERWSNHVVTIWALTYAEWVQEDLGLIGEYGMIEQQVLTAIHTPGSIKQWDAGTKDYYPEKFVKYVESRRKK